jgi:hypothetical protein
VVEPVGTGRPAVGRRRRGGTGGTGGTGAPPIWFGVPFALGGVLMIVLALGSIRSELQLRDEGVTVQGSVINKSIQTGSGDDPDTYRVRYEFVDSATGKTFTGTATVSREMYARIQQRSPVRVTYLPGDPTRNRPGTTEPDLTLGVVMLGFGTLFGLVGLALVATSIRARRSPAAADSGAPAQAPSLGAGPAITADLTPGELRRTDRFTRSPMGVFAELVGAPLAGIAFLAVAVWMLGQIGANPMFLLFAPFAGFFGVMLSSTIPTVLRRGIGLTLIEVGPNGIVHRDAGAFGWSELGELRIEHNRGAAGEAGTATYTRLGILPRDAARTASISRSLAWRMSRWFIRFANSRAASRGVRPLTDVDAIAPLGVYAYEIEQPFEQLIASVRRFTPVIDTPEVERQVATPLAETASPWTWAATVTPGPLATEASAPAAAPSGTTAVQPQSDANLRPLDAHLGDTTPTAGGPAALAALVQPAMAAAPESPAALVATSPSRRAPQAPAGPVVFRRRGFSLSDAMSLVMPGESTALPPVAGVIGLAAFGVVFMVVPTVGLISMALSSVGGGNLTMVLVPLGMAVVFFASGWFILRGTRRRWQLATGDPDLLTVGPEGIALRDGRVLAWSQIETVESTGSRLVVRPVGAPEDETVSLPFDMFEADDDTILDAIAPYHLVVEP